MVVPAHPNGGWAGILRGFLYSWFYLRGENYLLAADRKPPVEHGFEHRGRQRHSAGQQMRESGRACPGHLSRHGLEQVARTRQDMTKTQLNQPEPIIFGWRLRANRHGSGCPCRRSLLREVALPCDAARAAYQFKNTR